MELFWLLGNQLKPLEESGRQRRWTGLQRFRRAAVTRAALEGTGDPFLLVSGLPELLAYGGSIADMLVKTPARGIVFAHVVPRTSKEWRDAFCLGCGKPLTMAARDRVEGEVEQLGTPLALGHDLPMCPAFDAASTMAELDAVTKIVPRSEPAEIRPFPIRPTLPAGASLARVHWRSSHELVVTMGMDGALEVAPRNAIGELTLGLAFVF